MSGAILLTRWYDNKSKRHGDNDDNDSGYDYAPAASMEGSVTAVVSMDEGDDSDDGDDGGYDYAPAA
ncbi:hypothetical protein C5167_012480 [Papaver somniferum]|uniref:Uncharacterized protein n=1 Tax=Papaver somniferum TaxID=3469 RepID=A0A4Y7J1K0_PAPSO|nr:hypothetical protein C5167_012480 [Papaver somniferum]